MEYRGKWHLEWIGGARAVACGVSIDMEKQGESSSKVLKEVKNSGKSFIGTVPMSDERLCHRRIQHL